MLQERLSGFTDAVECHLQSEISARSDSFFAALHVLTDLSARISATRLRAGALRSAVRELDESVLGGAARLALLARRRRHALQALEALRGAEALAHSLADLALLLEAGDFGAALEVLEEARKALRGDDAPRLHCFRHLGQRLDAAAAAVEKLLTAEFVRAARPPRLRAGALPRAVAQPLRRAARAAAAEAAASAAADAGTSDGPEAPPEAAGGPTLELEDEEDDPSADPSSISGADAIADDEDDEGGARDEEAMSDALRPLAAGLLRLGRLPSALRSHGDAAQLDVRSAVKEVLGAALAQIAAAAAAETPAGAAVASSLAVPRGDAESRSERSLGERLRCLPLDAYAGVLEGVGAALRQCVARAAKAHALVAELLRPPDARGTPRRSAGAAHHAVPMAPAAREEALRASGDALAACCDAAAQRWAKLLLVRAPVHARLRPAQLAQLAQLSGAFADALDTAAASGGRRATAAPLRAVVAAQARALLAAQHSAALAKLGGALDAEAWARADVPAELQAAADALVAAASGAPPPPPPLRGAAPAPALMLDGASFAVVPAALVLLRCLAQHCDAAAQLPALLGGDVPSRAAELLKLFNARSCALVLGAGALQCAGLKSITAKHLALCSQSLALAGAALPHARAALARALPPQRAPLLLAPLDRVAADLRLHRAELHAKLVTIASERLAGHARRLPEEAAAWAAEAPAAVVPASALAKQVEHELGVLSRVLVPLLPAAEAAALFARVAAAFDKQLADGLARAAGAGGAAQAHVAADAAALAAALRSLPRPENGGDAAPALAALAASAPAAPVAPAVPAPPAAMAEEAPPPFPEGEDAAPVETTQEAPAAEADAPPAADEPTAE